jgi:hypothetical protein
MDKPRQRDLDTKRHEQGRIAADSDKDTKSDAVWEDTTIGMTPEWASSGTSYSCFQKLWFTVQTPMIPLNANFKSSHFCSSSNAKPEAYLYSGSVSGIARDHYLENCGEGKRAKMPEKEKGAAEANDKDEGRRMKGEGWRRRGNGARGKSRSQWKRKGGRTSKEEQKRIDWNSPTQVTLVF